MRYLPNIAIKLSAFNGTYLYYGFIDISNFDTPKIIIVNDTIIHILLL